MLANTDDVLQRMHQRISQESTEKEAFKMEYFVFAAVEVAILQRSFDCVAISFFQQGKNCFLFGIYM